MALSSQADRPIATFRRRNRPIRRLTWELGGGLSLAAAAYFLPILYSWEAWISIAFLIAASLGVVFGLVRAFSSKRDTITLYPDHLVWRDYRGRRKEASYAQILDIKPDRHQHRYLVRVQGAGGFWISPETEGFSDLWRRLGEPQIIRDALPRGREPWGAVRSCAPRSSHLALGLGILVVSGVLLVSFFDREPILLFLGIVGAMVSSQMLLSILFERVEIEGDEMVHHSWIPGLHRSIPLSCIVGACLFDGKGQRSSVIDTDHGEIRFSSGFKGAGEFVREAERLGAARYGRAEILRGDGS